MLHLCRFRPPVWLAVAGLLVAVPVPGSAEESAEPVERPALADARPARTDSIADALLMSGDYSGALARYEHDLMTARVSLPPEHPDLAVYHDRLGTLSWMLGDDERARTELEAALLIYERAHGANYGPMVDVLDRLGAIALELGDAPAAVKAHKRALAIAENDDPTGAAAADALDRLGTALGAAGELKPAAEAHLRALQLYEGLEGDSSRRVPCLQHLAESARRLGDRDRARAYLLRSRSILIATDGGNEHSRMAVSIGGLADLAAAEGDQDRARAHRREAAAILRRALGSEHPLLAGALAAYAGSLIRTGHNVEAVDAALEAESIRRDHLRFIARSLPEGQALRHEARLASGIGAAVAASIRTWDSTVVERVWDAAIRSRALVLDEMAARHHWAHLPADSATVALAAGGIRTRQSLARLSLRGPDGMDTRAYRATLDFLRTSSEGAERSLQARNPSVHRERRSATAGLAEIRSVLPPGTALVSLVRYLDPTVGPRSSASTASGTGEPSAWSYAAFVTAASSAHARVIPLGDAEELDSLVSTWREAVKGRVGSQERGTVADERKLGRILRQRLWDPIAPHVAEAGRVVFVPDGAFHLVNPVALPLDEDRFLVEQGPTFQIVSSERDLIGPARASPPGTGFLVLADPAFDAPRRRMSSLTPEPERNWRPPDPDDVYRGSVPCAPGSASPWAPLPGSAREVDAIAQLWERHGGGAPLILLGEAATEGSFKKEAPGKKWLHLATHGFFADACAGGENPLLGSGLVLAGANRRRVVGATAVTADSDSAIASAGPERTDRTGDSGAGAREDGILTSDEIAAMDLGGVETAVLSGCETGVGVVRAGEGVLGLRRAFEIAGARTLVMSLWPVTDRAAREWTVRFYEARLEKGLDPSSAARDASRRMLEERRAAGEPLDPASWAAFIAAGR